MKANTMGAARMGRRALAVFMAAAMSAACCACGAGADPPAAQTAEGGSAAEGVETQMQDTNVSETKTGEAAAQTQQSNPYGIDPSLPCWAAFDEPVTITTVYEENTAAKYAPGDDITSNLWHRDYEQYFNVKVETLWTSTEYMNKLNLSIASGQLPDVFRCNTSQLVELMDAGLLMDVTDLVEEYASPRVRECLDADPNAMEPALREGRLYGIPQLHYGSIDDPDFLWIRQDWLDSCGLSRPQTWEDWEKILYAFTNEDPDGNGQNDTYGFGLDKGLSQMKMMAVAFGAHPGIWIKDESGKLVYGNVQKEMKGVLETFAKWYKDGVINTDFISQDTDAMNQNFISGKVGATCSHQATGWVPGIDVIKNNGNEAVMYPTPIPSQNGETVMHTVDWGNSLYTVITKDCKNPEAVMKLINFYIYMNNDATDISWDTVLEHMENDMPHITGAFRMIDPNADWNQYKKIWAAFDTRDESVFTTPPEIEKYKGALKWLDNKDPDGYGYWSQMAAYDIANTVLTEGKYLDDEFHGVSVPTMVKKGSTLDALLQEGFTQMITGVKPIDYFDTLVDSWNKSGGAQMTEEMNEMYGN